MEKGVFFTSLWLYQNMITDTSPWEGYYQSAFPTHLFLYLNILVDCKFTNSDDSRCCQPTGSNFLSIMSILLFHIVPFPLEKARQGTWVFHIYGCVISYFCLIFVKYLLMRKKEFVDVVFALSYE